MRFLLKVSFIVFLYIFLLAFFGVRKLSFHGVFHVAGQRFTCILCKYDDAHCKAKLCVKLKTNPALYLRKQENFVSH